MSMSSHICWSHDNWDPLIFLFFWSWLQSRYADQFLWLGCLAHHTSQGPWTWVMGSCNSYHAHWDWHLKPQGAVPSGSNSLKEVRFIAWQMLMGPRHFWECRACLGYGPMPGPTLKKALCHTLLVSGTYDKYHGFYPCWRNGSWLWPGHFGWKKAQ